MPYTTIHCIQYSLALQKEKNVNEISLKTCLILISRFWYNHTGCDIPIKQFGGIIRKKSGYIKNNFLFSKLVVHTILYSFSFENNVLKIAAVSSNTLLKL